MDRLLPDHFKDHFVAGHFYNVHGGLMCLARHLMAIDTKNYVPFSQIRFKGMTLPPYLKIEMNIANYFMLSGRISRNIGENIFRSYTGTTSENTDFDVLVAKVYCACLTTRWKYDVIYFTFLALDVIL